MTVPVIARSPMTVAVIARSPMTVPVIERSPIGRRSNLTVPVQPTIASVGKQSLLAQRTLRTREPCEPGELFGIRVM